MHVAVAPDFDVAAFPTVTEAAAMLGVIKSTVSKHMQSFEVAGAVKRLPPAEVLRIGLRQRRVPLTEVGHALVEYARRHSPAHGAEVEAEVYEFFARDRERAKRRISREEFLGQARELLDERAYRELEARYDAAHGRRPVAHLVSSLEGVDA